MSPEQESALLLECARIEGTVSASDLGHGGRLEDSVVHQDLFEVLPLLPTDSIDLVVADPPYNLRKSFHGRTFGARSHEAYAVFVSSWMGELVFDPFAGSGTTLVTAKKLGRRFLGVEIESRYAAISVARLRKASVDSRIQGYEGGVFFDRNFRS